MLFWKQLQSESIRRSFFQFIAQNDIDTDCIEDDVAIFVEENNSNLYCALNGDNKIMDAVRIFMRRQRIMSKSFATGYPLCYWKWYHNATAEEVKGNYVLNSKFDFGGRPVQDFVVYPRHKNLKEEVLATGLLSTAQFVKSVVQKAARYLKTRHCRSMKSKMRWKRDPLHFGIEDGSPLQPQHLYAIILYCDCTKFCTLFSLSLRETNHGDGLTEVRCKNGAFFYVSKYLREIVTYFGSDGGKNCMNGVVRGPFFSGVSTVLNVSEFRMRFNTPTSTSMSLPVAWRFAGNSGMVIAIGNQKGFSKTQPLFNATWISAFAEEDEYLWFGSINGVSVDDIIIVSSSRAYRESIGALYLFDVAFTGQEMGKTKVDESQKEILDFCIKSALNQPIPPQPIAVDQYVLDNFYCFRQKKTKLVLNPFRMNKNDEYLTNLLFYGISSSKEVPKDNINIFRPFLFELFPNMVELVLWLNNGYALNFLSLLSVLEEAATVIPQSFEVLKVHETALYNAQKWMKTAFEAIPDIKEQFAAKNWLIEMDETKKWIFIKRKM